MPDDVQAKRCMLFGGLRMVYERSVNPMYKYILYEDAELFEVIVEEV